GDTHQADVDQLRSKLQQLDQSMAEVKTQLAGMEKEQQLADATSPAAAPSTATETATTPPPEEKKPNPENTLEIYGHVMLDAGYNFGESDPDWFDVVRPTKLPAFKDQFPKGTVFFSVRQSRFGVKTSTPTELGQLKTIFEF